MANLFNRIVDYTGITEDQLAGDPPSTVWLVNPKGNLISVQPGADGETQLESYAPADAPSLYVMDSYNVPEHGGATGLRVDSRDYIEGIGRGPTHLNLPGGADAQTRIRNELVDSVPISSQALAGLFKAYRSYNTKAFRAACESAYRTSALHIGSTVTKQVLK